jgi:uncharacterized damage-inducible protein DinB
MAESEPADNSVLTTLFAHNTWANLRLLDYCEALPAEQLEATAPGTYGAIRDTLWHVIGGEVSYVTRVNGRLPDLEVKIKRDEVPSFDAMRQIARWTGDELLQLALAARADTLVQETEPGYPLMAQYHLSHLIMQAINHANEHRTHVSTILTQLGLEPPDMTGWGYMEATGDFQEVPIPEA